MRSEGVTRGKPAVEGFKCQNRGVLAHEGSREDTHGQSAASEAIVDVSLRPPTRTVQLVIYPDGDSTFASEAAISLKIDLPADYSPREVALVIQEHLRTKYPLAEIHVHPATDGGFDGIWHVYRDGLPASAGNGMDGA